MLKEVVIKKSIWLDLSAPGLQGCLVQAGRTVFLQGVLNILNFLYR